MYQNYIRTVVAKQLFGITYYEALEKGICIDCKEEALPNCYSEAGREEYKISGLCEKCFDKFTDVPELKGKRSGENDRIQPACTGLN